MVMSNCCHNVYESLHKRYLKETPDYGGLDMALVHRIIDDLAMRLKPLMLPFDINAFINKKKGKLRKRYMRAYGDLIKDGFDVKRDSNIAAFVKLERYFELGKSPRMIMGRNPKFNLLYAHIIEPIEAAFFSLPQVANACDYVSCGEKFEKLLGDHFMENDMSKYEASQGLDVLKLEHLLYSKITDHGDLLDILFAIKTLKRGHTQSGIKFEFELCRGSGDMDTSLGNGVLNYIATQYFQIKNFCPDCPITGCSVPNCKTNAFVVKGDDSYSSVPRFCKYNNYYKNFGFDAKILIRTCPEDVEFCSGHFVEYQPSKYIYVQKLQKMLTSLTTVVNQDVLRHGWVAHYYKTLGLMYKKLYKGLPIYDDVAEFLLRTSEYGVNINLMNSYNLVTNFSYVNDSALDVDYDLAMSSVALVNKMTIPELAALKDWLKFTTLKFPQQLSKRCNIKSAKCDAPVELNTGDRKSVV